MKKRKKRLRSYQNARNYNAIISIYKEVISSFINMEMDEFKKNNTEF